MGNSSARVVIVEKAPNKAECPALQDHQKLAITLVYKLDCKEKPTDWWAKLSLYQPPLRKTRADITGDNEVIEDSDIYESERLLEGTGQ